MVADERIIVKQMQIADLRWRAAIEQSEFAPPDDGFADRLRDISVAALAEATALEMAAGSPRLRWNPVPDSDAIRHLTDELRPGANRPGPRELWDQFDDVVTDLGHAQAGTDLAAIAHGFRMVGELTAQIAAAVDEERIGGAGRETG